MAQVKRVGYAMQALAWLSFMVVGVLFFGDRLESQYNPNRHVDSRTSNAISEVTLQRNRLGHYVASGSINAQPVTFLLDTGATGVAIPSRIANDLKLQRGRPIATRTANGTVTSYQTSLNSVSIGDIALENVGATVAPGLRGDEILLGMSFLKHIEFTQRDDMLILKQYH